MDQSVINALSQFDLGTWCRTITTESRDVQAWFNRGLNWTYAFNQEAAEVCFREALSRDPCCAMAWWGLAYSQGPFYNREWIHFTRKEIAQTLPVCHDAAVNAVRFSHGCTPTEEALAAAIALRYQDASTTAVDDLNAWQFAFTDAMRSVHAQWPEDADVVALFAEALLTCHPRQQWDLITGKPNDSTFIGEALEVLEKALEAEDRSRNSHPATLHMYIHAMEMSPCPERAIPAADRLCGLVPDAGHLEHMPGHIYALCGDYVRAEEQSERAECANDRYLEEVGTEGLYLTSICHDLHLHMHTSMLMARYRSSRLAAERMRELVTVGLIRRSPPYLAQSLDGYAAMFVHMLVRFGLWKELLGSRPPHPEYTPICAAMYAYGQGIGYAALGETRQADEAREALHTAILAIPADAIILNNAAIDVLAVGTAMLEGEIAYRQGAYDRAFERIRCAVDRDDKLNYTEPWAWMQPTRHALGALLAEQGHWDEAAEVFQADLGDNDLAPRCRRHPENVWALRGLLDCAENSVPGLDRDRVNARLERARSMSDVAVDYACLCSGR